MPDPDNETHRPSPDALLERAAQETRGRLKVFLGSAPGVGKTYEMLESGRALLADGQDVVIGVVETHGRAETAALLGGFQIIPRKQTLYRCQTLEEMDLDAIIARAPRLALVDELAHTNAPGSRHPKRYLDVLELLDRGIDVYTTLNIQHVESLNDVVAQITRIRVRETVPDSILDRADDIEIIDLTPDDLIKRLHEGKVYLPRTAKRAIQNYFSPGNLTALRELALRRTAQRVDAQLLNHMQAHGVRGPWPSGDRILVCIDASARGPALVRYAKRQADRMRASWTALHVELAQDIRLADPQKDRIASTLRLAEQLGGEAVTLPGQGVVREILRHALTHNFSHVIVGRTEKPRWQEWLRGSVSTELIRQARDLNVHVVAGRERERPPTRAMTFALPRELSLLPYLQAVLYTAIAVLTGAALTRIFDVRNIGLVFLMAVLTSAATAGLMPALFASVLGALAYNYFFLDPLYTLAIRDPESVVALVFFLGAAAITSNLTARVHRQARAARIRARTTESLYLFSKRLSVAGTLDDVLWVTVNQMATMLCVNTVLLLPEGDKVTVRAGFPPDDTLDDADIAAAQWAFAHNLPAGRGADTLPGARRLYLPLRTGRMTVGVVGLDNDRSGPLLTPDQSRLFDALADQAALAIERIQLVDDLDQARLVAETDKLRSALLTSISHDLRTPLAGIMGAAGMLSDYSDELPDESRRDLLATVIEESERLNRFIANLLDMTRIESGMTAPNALPVYLDEMVGAVLRRAQTILAGHRVQVTLPPALPLLRLDPVLFEQVLFNLLDNAAKYAPAQTGIGIDAWRDGSHVTLQIRDEGPGIPEPDLERIFDIFYRVRKTDQILAGTGLGLAICRGFVEAMGGTIRASNRRDHSGAVFTIRLPIPDDDKEPEIQA
ncbi:sensor histidine kinase [Paracoccus laeviglucosivorans]|uniref:histidine kinase n=1 Tax=Paracoccus laeviglucosivorans TaxID=1197861 RepID=A0A521AHS8_9RHOB|nr:sensor histidine kinase KdpD [Paracoccus laeviglucosivorans]SMO34384.1 two-component system, OmpR family, sensor histidine kinase KdpD [Paracoccus laeviglucosivorans]